MRLIEFSNQSVSFADWQSNLAHVALAALYHPSKYISIDASIISIYSLSAAPLVVTQQKGHSQIALKMSYTYH